MAILPQRSILMLLAGAESRGFVNRGSDGLAAVRQVLHQQRRLALLGDAILALESTEVLLRCAPLASAAEVSDAKSHIESNVSLSEVAARALAISDGLLHPPLPLSDDYRIKSNEKRPHSNPRSLGQHYRQSRPSVKALVPKGNHKPWADAVEGIIGLVSVERGRAAASELTRKLIVAPLARDVGGDDACLQLALRDLELQVHLTNEVSAHSAQSRSWMQSSLGAPDAYSSQLEASDQLIGRVDQMFGSQENHRWVDRGRDGKPSSEENRGGGGSLLSRSSCGNTEAWAAATAGGGQALAQLILQRHSSSAAADLDRDVSSTERCSLDVTPTSATPSLSQAPAEGTDNMVDDSIYRSLCGTESGLLRDGGRSQFMQLRSTRSSRSKSKGKSKGEGEGRDENLDPEAGANARIRRREVRRWAHQLRSACLGATGCEPVVRVRRMPCGDRSPPGSLPSICVAGDNASDDVDVSMLMPDKAPPSPSRPNPRWRADVGIQRLLVKAHGSMEANKPREEVLTWNHAGAAKYGSFDRHMERAHSAAAIPHAEPLECEGRDQDLGLGQGQGASEHVLASADGSSRSRAMIRAFSAALSALSSLDGMDRVLCSSDSPPRARSRQGVAADAGYSSWVWGSDCGGKER